MTDPKPEPLPQCGLPTWGRPCTRVRECSHTACPLRRPLTAGPGDRCPPPHDEDADRKAERELDEALDAFARASILCGK